MSDNTSEPGRLRIDNEAVGQRVAALEMEARRFKATLYSIGDAVIATDAASVIVQMNPVAEALTGWSEAEARGRTAAEVFNIVNEETGAKVESPVTRAVREGTVVGLANHTVLVARDGTRRPIADSGAPIRDEKGEVTGVVLVFRDQTAARAAQKALAEREAANRLHAELLHNAPVIAAFHDRDHNILWANRAYEQATGLSPKEIVGRKCWAVWRLTQPCRGCPVVTAIDSDETSAADLTPENQDHWPESQGCWHSRAAPVHDADGKVIGAIEVAIDITDRERAARDLEASESRYRRLFESVKDGILIIDAETGKIVDVNPFLMELTGYSRQEFLERHFWEIGPPEDTAAAKALFAEMQANEYVRYDDRLLKTKDGRHVDVELVSNVYGVGDKTLIQCNIRDITERKQAIAETLAVIEARCRSYYDATDHIGWIASSDGQVVEDLPSLRRFTGQTYEEAKGSGWAKAIHPDDLERALQALNSAVATKSAYELEYRMRRHDGVYRHFLARGGPVFRADGSVREWVGTCIDITERKRLETEHEKLEEQLRASQKMEAIGSLAGGVAHDFNNLLSVILSYTGFAMEAVRDGDPLKSDLLEVKKASERAAALTRQLLAFSRKQILQPVALDLNRIAAGVEKMLQRILGEDIELVQTLAPDLGLTLADPSQIEQVIMNLVVNARDVMPQGGKLTIETANVEIDEEYAARHVDVKPGSFVQLAVSDTGLGMDEQTRARIFEPFFTTKEKGKGTGLGLSTVYGIVKQSGGNIWVYSELGQGTTFKIYLPRELSATTATAIKPSTVSRLSKGTETILVVEDEEALRKVALRALGAAGYKVLTAADGDEALMKSAQYVGDIQMLLTDVVMPRMSGRVLAQELAKTRPTVKVVYMSGYTDNAIVHHGVLDAGTHFLAKPFTSADLTRKVREVLDEDTARVAGGREPAARGDAQIEEQSIDKAALRGLPEELLGKLRRAVTTARYDEIALLIETVRTTEPEVAAGLRRMADLFDYDGLRDLLGQAKEE